MRINSTTTIVKKLPLSAIDFSDCEYDEDYCFEWDGQAFEYDIYGPTSYKAILSNNDYEWIGEEEVALIAALDEAYMIAQEKYFHGG